jgi:rubrerythrin
MRKTHYLMTPYHALELARSAEIRAQQYYEAVAKESPNPEVRTLAIEFAYEEAEHVDLVNAWISRYPKPDPDWDYDPDPPGMPE